MALNIDLKNKRAFVSGCARGIGLGIARALAMAGCDVAGCGTAAAEHENVHNFIREVESHGRKALYVQGNLSERDTPARLMQAVAKQWGSLDVLISNAGRNIFKGAELCSEDDWDECMNLDLASHWRLAKAALPLLKASDHRDPGSIVIIGSNHANNTIPGCFPYNVAKPPPVCLGWCSRWRSSGDPMSVVPVWHLALLIRRATMPGLSPFPIPLWNGNARRIRTPSDGSVMSMKSVRFVPFWPARTAALFLVPRCLPMVDVVP